MSRRGFSHWLTEAVDLPEKLDDAELLSLYYRLRYSKDDSAVEPLLLGHLRLALSKVAEFATRSPEKIEEMVSEATDSLLDGILAIQNGAIDHHDSPNVTGYLMTRLTGRILRFLASDGILRVSISTYRRLQAKFGTDGKVFVFDGKGILAQRTAQTGEWNYRETLEVVNKAINKVQSDIKTDKLDLVRSVIDLRVEGLKDPEIGQRLGLTSERIRQIRASVKDNILELMR